MTGLSCAEVGELSGELASGVLSGPERADALAHLDHCAGCRVAVEELSEAADWLLLAAPDVDPPSGFKTAVVSALPGGARAQGPAPEAPTRSARRSRRVRWRRAVLSVAAIATVVVGGAVAGTGVVRSGAHGATAHPAADTTSLRSGRFQAAGGRQVGQVFAYGGSPSWIFLNVDDSPVDGTVVYEVQMTNGATVPVGTFDVHDGIGEWSHTVGVDVGQLRGAKLVTSFGSTLAAATFS